MGVGSELQELGRFLDDCERRAEAVDSLNVVEVTGVGDQRLTADLELRLSIESLSDGGASLCDPRIGPDGTIRFALEPTTGLPLSTDHDVSVTPTDVALDDEDCVTVTLAATVPADASESGTDEQTQTSSNQPTGDDHTADGSTDDEPSAALAVEAGVGDEPGTTTAAVDRADSSTDPQTTESASGRETAHHSHTSEIAAVDADDVSDSGTEFQVEASSTPTKREVPPFKDPDLLADIYKSCDTFAQMAEEIDMDVTGETVRRYMIQNDIHEPTSYQTSGDDATGQPVALADGIGLPDDVTVETLIETVKRSNTIHQVKRDIDIEREDALEMLKELNLLDLVVGRLATEGEREITRDDVIECLREASAVQ